MGQPILGRTVIGNVGTSIRCLVNGVGNWKTGGVTLDWNLVAAAGADLTLPDGVSVSAGEKFLRFGQVLAMAATAEVQTVTIANATGGTFLLTIPASTGQFPQTTLAVPWNATAQQMADLLSALPRVGPGGVSVALAGSVWTVTFNRSQGDVPQMTADVTNLVGAGAAVTVATPTPGVGTGLYGPFDPNATDGRQVITERGRIWVVDSTVKENDLKSNSPAVFDGGRVWRQRILATDGVHSLAAGPTWTELLAVLTELRPQWD